MTDSPRWACGNLCKKNGVNRLTGLTLYNTYCRSCAKTRHGTKDIRLKRHKKSVCSICGFVPVHHCQLDVDHIDGNSSNTSIDNLQTLCANCHRLKTYRGKDWKKNP